MPCETVRKLIAFPGCRHHTWYNFWKVSSRLCCMSISIASWLLRNHTQSRGPRAEAFLFCQWCLSTWPQDRRRKNESTHRDSPMNVKMCMYIMHIYKCMYTYIYMYIYIHTKISMRMLIHTHVCIRMRAHRYRCVCIHNMYIGMIVNSTKYIYINVLIRVHLDMYKQKYIYISV